MTFQTISTGFKMEIIPNVDAKLIDEIEWLYHTLISMKGDFSKPMSKEVLGKSLEFAKGMFFQREIDLKEILDLKNHFNVKIARLRAKVDLFRRNVEVEFDA